MEISYFCSSCQRKASKVCVHASCQLNPFMCQQDCSKAHFHNEPQFKQIDQLISFAQSLHSQNVFYRVKLLKEKIAHVCSCLDQLLKKYENQLIAVGKKPSLELEKIAQKVLQETQKSDLKGKDLHRLLGSAALQQEIVIEVKKEIQAIFQKPLKQIQKLGISDISSLNLVDSHNNFEIACKLNQERKYNEALGYFIAAYKKNFADAQIIFETALCLENLEDFQKSQQWFMRCVSKDKKGLFISKSYNQIGEIAMKKKNYIKAIDCFRRAHTVESNQERQAFYLYNRSKAYQANGDYQMAIEDLNNAIEKHETSQYINKLQQIKEKIRITTNNNKNSELDEETKEESPQKINESQIEPK